MARALRNVLEVRVPLTVGSLPSHPIMSSMEPQAGLSPAQETSLSPISCSSTLSSCSHSPSSVSTQVPTRNCKVVGESQCMCANEAGASALAILTKPPNLSNLFPHLSIMVTQEPVLRLKPQHTEDARFSKPHYSCDCYRLSRAPLSPGPCE